MPISSRLRALAPYGGIFAFALALRLAYLWSWHDSVLFTTPVGDAVAYLAWARSLAAGDWLGREVFYQAPLYPYFLGMLTTFFGDGPWAVRLVQAGLGSCSCAVLAAAGAAFFDRRTGIVAGIGLALYPPAIYFDGLIQKAALDGFFASIVLLDVCAAGRPGSPACGIRFGSRARASGSRARERARARSARGDLRRLERPAPRGLAPGAGARPARARARAAAAPRGSAQSGDRREPSSHDVATRSEPVDRKSPGSVRSLRAAPTGAWQRAFRARRCARAGRAGQWPQPVARRGLGLLARIARSHSRASGRASGRRLLARKWAMVWNARELPDTEGIGAYAEQSPLLGALQWILGFGVLAPLAAIGVVATRSDVRRLWVLWSWALLLAASVALFFVFARYRFTLVPVLMLFAASGVWAFVDSLRARRLGSRARRRRDSGRDLRELAAGCDVGHRGDALQRRERVARTRLPATGSARARARGRVAAGLPPSPRAPRRRAARDGRAGARARAL